MRSDIVGPKMMSEMASLTFCAKLRKLRKFIPKHGHVVCLNKF